MKRYFVRKGYFGEQGKLYISFLRFCIYKIFTDIVLHVEVNGKEVIRK